MAHPDPEHLTTIFNTFLETNAPGLSVGDGEAPESPSPAYPYLIAIPLTPADISGPLNDPNAYHDIEFDVLSTGLTRQQAQGGIAASNDVMLGTPQPDFTASGYKVTGAVKQVNGGPAVEYEQSDKPPLFMARQTYRMKVVPV